MLRGAPGMQQAAVESRLFELRGANLNSTADQPFGQRGAFTRYQIVRVMSVGRSGNANAAVGGIYTAAGKSGITIVSALQAWGALSAVDKVLSPTLIALADSLQADPILSLTLPSGAPCTADIFIYGVILD